MDHVIFTSSNANLPELLSKAMISDAAKGGNWYVDMKSGNIKYIVFRNKILKYEIGNAQQKDAVCEECKKLGITEKEMDWSE